MERTLGRAQGLVGPATVAIVIAALLVVGTAQAQAANIDICDCATTGISWQSSNGGMRETATAAAAAHLDVSDVLARLNDVEQTGESDGQVVIDAGSGTVTVTTAIIDFFDSRLRLTGGAGVVIDANVERRDGGLDVFSTTPAITFGADSPDPDNPQKITVGADSTWDGGGSKGDISVSTERLEIETQNGSTLDVMTPVTAPNDPVGHDLKLTFDNGRTVLKRGAGASDVGTKPLSTIKSGGSDGLLVLGTTGTTQTLNAEDITFDTPVALDGGTVFNASSVRFQSTLGSVIENEPSLAHDLEINGEAYFGGPVGGDDKPLGELAVSGFAKFESSAERVITNGAQDYSSTVQFDGNTTVSSAGTLTFAGDVVGDEFGTVDLTIDGGTDPGANPPTTNTPANSETRFVGDISSDDNKVGSIDVTSTGSVVFGNDANALTVRVNDDLAVAGTTEIQGAGLASVSVGSASFGSDVTLAGNVELDAAGTVSFGGVLTATTSGEQSFLKTGEGSTSFAGSVGTTRLSSFGVNGTATFDGAGSQTVATTGTQTFGDAVTVDGSGTKTFSAGGGTSFAGALTGADSGETDVVVDGGASQDSATTFNGSVTALRSITNSSTDTDPTTIFANGGNAITFAVTGTAGAGIDLAGGALFDTSGMGRVTMDAGDRPVTLHALTAGNGSAAGRLTVNTTGDTRFEGDIGTSGTRFSNISTNAGGTTYFGDGTGSQSVYTTTGSTIGDAAVLVEDLSIDHAGASGASFSYAGGLDGTTPGEEDLTFSGDAVRLASDVGATTGLGAIASSATTLYFSKTSADTSVYPDGGFSATGAVAVETGGKTVTIDTTADKASTISLAAATAANTSSLALASNGTKTLAGDVGATGARLGSLTTTGGGAVALGGAVFADAASFSSSVDLAADVTLTGAGAVTFAGALDGAHDFARAGTGTTDFQAPVGGVTPLDSLDVSADGETTAAGTIIAGGDLSFTGPLSLSGGAGLESTTGKITTDELSLDATSHTIDVGGSGSAIEGELTGAAGATLEKDGAGALALSADSHATMLGSVQLTEGQLFVGDDLSGATFGVGGGTLGGTGTTGALTAAGGTVSPGNSPGTLRTGNLALEDASTYAAELDGTASGSFDQLAVTGTVDLGSASLDVDGSAVPATDSSFEIVDNDGVDAVAGQFAGLAEGDTVPLNGGTLTITYAGGDGNDVVLFADALAPPVPPPPAPEAPPAPEPLPTPEPPAGPVAGQSAMAGVARQAQVEVGGRFVEIEPGKELTLPVTVRVGQGGKLVLNVAAVGGGTQRIVVGAGEFVVAQTTTPPTSKRATASAGKRAYTRAELSGRSFNVCLREPRGSRRIVRAGTIRAKQPTYTTGRYSTGAARGSEAATWITQDRCDGTMTIVRRGTVMVYDRTLRKSIRLTAGQRYIARAKSAGA